MSETIPKSVMAEAMRALMVNQPEMVESVARALMAEREACARIAETAGCYMAESCGDGPASHSIGVWRGKSGPEIASAIRDRAKT